MENPVSFINNVDLFFELLCPRELVQVSRKVPVWVSWSTRYTVIRFIWRLISYYDHILLYWSVYKTPQPCRKNNRVGNPHVHVDWTVNHFFCSYYNLLPSVKIFPILEKCWTIYFSETNELFKKRQEGKFRYGHLQNVCFGVVWISKMYTVKIKKFYLKSVHCTRS